MSCPEIETVEVLYNPPYGGFIFPDKFLKEWETRYGSRLDTDSRGGTGGYGYADWCPISVRVDPRVVSLYKELYPDGPFAIAVIPKELAPFIEIHEYDGSESVGIDEGRAFKSIIDNYLSEPDATKDQLRKQLERFNELRRRPF